MHQRPAHAAEDAEDAGNHGGDVRGAAHGQGGLLDGQLPEGGQAEEDQLEVQVPPRHGGGPLLDVRRDPLVRVVALQPHVRARHEGALAHVPAPLPEDRRLRNPPAGEGPVSRGHARLLDGRQAEELHRCVCVLCVVCCVIRSGQVRSSQSVYCVIETQTRLKKERYFKAIQYTNYTGVYCNRMTNKVRSGQSV